MFRFRRRPTRDIDSIADLATLLSEAWNQPGSDLVRSIVNESWQRRIIALSRGLKAEAQTDILQATAVMSRAIKPNSDATSLSDTFIDESVIVLASEYAALFQGPGRPLVPAYECQWIDGEHASLFISPSSLAVEDAYRRAGVVMANSEPPDSLPVELDFISHLSRAEKYSRTERTSYSEQRREFVAQHIDRWVPQFCTATEHATEHGAYSALARITRTIVSSGILKD